MLRPRGSDSAGSSSASALPTHAAIDCLRTPAYVEYGGVSLKRLCTSSAKSGMASTAKTAPPGAWKYSRKISASPYCCMSPKAGCEPRSTITRGLDEPQSGSSRWKRLSCDKSLPAGMRTSFRWDQSTSSSASSMSVPERKVVCSSSASPASPSFSLTASTNAGPRRRGGLATTSGSAEATAAALLLDS